MKKKIPLIRLADNGLWLFKDRITLSKYWGKDWDLKEIGLIDLSYNRWRPGYQCLDINWRFGRLILTLTIWNMPFQKKYMNKYMNDSL